MTFVQKRKQTNWGLIIDTIWQDACNLQYMPCRFKVWKQDHLFVFPGEMINRDLRFCCSFRPLVWELFNQSIFVNLNTKQLCVLLLYLPLKWCTCPQHLGEYITCGLYGTSQDIGTHTSHLPSTNQNLRHVEIIIMSVFVMDLFQRSRANLNGMMRPQKEVFTVWELKLNLNGGLLDGLLWHNKGLVIILETCWEK